MSRANPDDQVRFERYEELDQLEFLDAHYAHFAFVRHWHETYVVQIVESGVDAFEVHGEELQAGPGCLVLLNPFEVHTGRPTGGDPLRYCAVYPTQELLSQVTRAMGRGSGAPRFRQPVLHHPALARRCLAALRSARGESDPRRRRARIVDMLACVLSRSESRTEHASRPDGRSRAVRLAADHLDCHYARAVSLQELSQLTGLSRYHFLRRFHREIGVPPHEYLVNVRVSRAKQLLRGGARIAQVAEEVGFNDQSHLTRRFKRVVGLTPGQYAAKSNPVQYGAGLTR